MVDRRSIPSMCDFREKDCELELKIYNYDLKEMKEFECEQAKISHLIVEEDCPECFELEEDDMIMGRLQKEAKPESAKYS
ncbi:hypothetical protein IFR05_016161 [Cadophora sp. M221]|nr:hypothetical protein IFR05_016161 [Cadophora sp. M221]